MRRFIIRTVRNGMVKFGNTNFVPSNRYAKYDGRLDGLRLAFGLYTSYDTENDNPVEYRGEKYLPYISLWGTEKEYIDINQDVNAPYIVDGALPWDMWYPENEEEHPEEVVIINTVW